MSLLRYLIFILCLPLTQLFSQPSKINLIGYFNGVGVAKDLSILLKELDDLGYLVHCTDYRNTGYLEKADFNIFVEVTENLEHFLPLAKKNYFLPNAEHCFLDTQQLSKFDKILCKTKEGERIFKQFNPNTVFISFTSEDKYNPIILKSYHQVIHLAGGSRQKGTHRLVKVWLNNPQFPRLFLVQHEHLDIYPDTLNIKSIDRYLENSQLKLLQNMCGFHICPSETEGFGHYIMEALSCESVVITTNAPPMNEFVMDKRCLVDYEAIGQQKLATTYYVSSSHLEKILLNILSLSKQDLEEIGRKNREFYLSNQKFFKEKLAEIFQQKSKS